MKNETWILKNKVLKKRLDIYHGVFMYIEEMLKYPGSSWEEVVGDVLKRIEKIKPGLKPVEKKD